MIGWCQDCHLVSIDTIKVEESLNLCRNLRRRKVFAPIMKEIFKHAEGTAFGDFAESTEYTEFFVGHAHVYFIGLDIVLCDGFEFGSWCGVEEFIQDRYVE